MTTKLNRALQYKLVAMVDGNLATLAIVKPEPSNGTKFDDQWRLFGADGQRGDLFLSEQCALSHIQAWESVGHTVQPFVCSGSLCKTPAQKTALRVARYTVPNISDGICPHCLDAFQKELAILKVS